MDKKLTPLSFIVIFSLLTFNQSVFSHLKSKELYKHSVQFGIIVNTLQIKNPSSSFNQNTINLTGPTLSYQHLLDISSFVHPMVHFFYEIKNNRQYILRLELRGGYSISNAEFTPKTHFDYSRLYFIAHYDLVEIILPFIKSSLSFSISPGYGFTYLRGNNVISKNSRNPRIAAKGLGLFPTGSFSTLSMDASIGSCFRFTHPKTQLAWVTHVEVSGNRRYIDFSSTFSSKLEFKF